MRETYHDKHNKMLIDKQQKLLIYSLYKKMKVFHEQWYQRIKQQEEELSQFRETYHNKQHKTMIDSSANGMNVSHQLFRIKEESLKQMRE